jgi:hypothetical protein
MEKNCARKESAKEKRKCRVISCDTAVDETREYFEEEARGNKRHSVTQPLEQTAACFGLSRRSIINIRNRLEKGEQWEDEETRNRAMEVPEPFVSVVREAIVNIYADKEHVTLDTLLQKLASGVRTRATCWEWSRATLYRFLTAQMGYNYGARTTYYQELKEDVAIAAQRIAYIKQVKKFRAEGWHIFYQDETWINKNMTPAMIWLDADGKGGRKVPQDKGERSIICHIGGDSGFVIGARLIFRGSKSLNDSNYHTDMNDKVFLD